MTPAGEARPQGSTRKVEPTSPTPEDRVRLELLTCGTTEGRSVRCGARACGLLAVAGRAQRVVTRGCAAVARIRQQAAGSRGDRTCSGEHVEREQQQLAFLLFSCGRTRCRSAPASARSAPARRRRERRLEARSTHCRPLLAPASRRGKRVMVQWIGRRREQGASCGCTPASCSPRLASSGEGGAQDSLCRFVCFCASAPRPHRTAPPSGQEVAVLTVSRRRRSSTYLLTYPTTSVHLALCQEVSK